MVSIKSIVHLAVAVSVGFVGSTSAAAVKRGKHAAALFPVRIILIALPYSLRDNNFLVQYREPGPCF